MLPALKTSIALGGDSALSYLTERVSVLFVFGRSSSYMVNPGWTLNGSASQKLVPQQQSGLRILGTGHQTNTRDRTSNTALHHDVHSVGLLMVSSCLHLHSSACQLLVIMSNNSSIPTSMASEQPGKPKQVTDELIANLEP